MVGELSLGLAQEIRNPLTGAKLSLEIFSDEVVTSEEERVIVSKVINEIERIESLLKNFLDFARPSKPQIISVDINNILDKTIIYSLKHPSLSSNTVTSMNVLRDFDKNLPEVMVDPIHLQQAFLHLILNAIDAMLVLTCKNNRNIL